MKTKDLFLLIAIVLLAFPDITPPKFSFALDKFQTISSEGMVAIQSANTKFEEHSPDKVIPSPVCNCNGTGKVKSGDGIFDVPCPCGDKCKCKKPNDQGQAPPVQETKEEQKQEQYVRYYFGAKWCGPCIIFKRDDIPALIKSGWTFSDKESSDVTVVDVDENPTLFQKYSESNPQSIPYFVITRNGKIIKSRTGYVNYIDYANWSNQVINEHKAKK